jgi:hypothetical protein
MSKQAIFESVGREEGRKGGREDGRWGGRKEGRREGGISLLFISPVEKERGRKNRGQTEGGREGGQTTYLPPNA